MTFDTNADADVMCKQGLTSAFVYLLELANVLLNCYIVVNLFLTDNQWTWWEGN